MPQTIKNRDSLLKAPFVSSAYSVGIGDALVVDSQGGIQTASAAGWGDEVTARRNHVGQDAGIAIDGSPTNKDRSIRALPDGSYVYDCTSTTFNIGDLFGLEKDAGGNFLDTDKLQRIDDATQASFYAIERATSAATTVRCRKLPPRKFNPQVGEAGPFLLSVASAHRSSTPTVGLSGWNFGKPVRATTAILTMTTGALSSDVGVVLYNGTTQFLTSLSLPAGATIGDTVSIDLGLESSGAELFGPTDQFQFHTEGPVGAGDPRLAVSIRYVYPI